MTRDERRKWARTFLGLGLWGVFYVSVVPHFPPLVQRALSLGVVAWAAYALGVLTERRRRILDQVRHCAELAELRALMEGSFDMMKVGQREIDRALEELVSRVKAGPRKPSAGSVN